jgi:7-cyano-7-deazaguanine synthase
MMSLDRQPQAVVLLSGGLDSTTCLALARHDGFACHAVSFRYGQRHAVELLAATTIAAAAGVEHVIVDIDLRAFGGSALTADIDVPKHADLSAMAHDGAGNRSAIPVTYVPARNTIFLSFALALAEVRGARDIYIGVNALDYSGYPDCRPEFIGAYERLANLATRSAVEPGDPGGSGGEGGDRPIRIRSPLISLTKAEIIRRGAALGVDFAATTSCYDPLVVSASGPRSTGDEPGRWLACGQCASCLLRQKGFAEAGLVDPIGYVLPEQNQSPAAASWRRDSP